MLSKSQLTDIDTCLDAVELFFADCNERGSVKPSRDLELDFYAITQTIKNAVDAAEEE